MIILGIDPGTVVTGYGLIETDGTNFRAIDYGCIRPPSNLKLSDRYLVIFNALEELIEKYSPDAMAIETQYVAKNPQSAIKLGMARGIAVVAAKRRGMSVFEYSPSKAKSSVVGNGRASKEQVQGMVKMLLKLTVIPTPEDAADALALAICHGQSIRYRELCSAEI